MVFEVTRAQVVAYRIAAHGFDRRTPTATELAVLDLGVQDTRGSASVALAARLPATAAGDPVAEDGPLALLWSFRGAPHLHRRDDLAALSAALWPRGDADAMARLSTERSALKAAGVGGVEAFTAVATALRAAVSGPTPKGEVSAAVTAALPDAYSYQCRGCGATHVYGGILQQVGLPAGVRHRPGSSPLLLTPLENRPPVPEQAAGASAVADAYLRLHGPATPAEFAGYLGTSQAEVRPAWPADLVEVRVDGRRAWLPDAEVAALRRAEAPELTRLLPPLDPFLQARDRGTLVPDPLLQKEVWRVLGNPGALLHNGEIAGTWRSKGSGRRRLDVSVRPFARLSRAGRAAVEAEADRLAAVRGFTEVGTAIEQD
ncbi:winged helix DNA-binding domain-containing protein [Solihabitans fulvus]|nr:winged helix DNA-binding domain-containing protein [Solihabitans fulvus]